MENVNPQKLSYSALPVGVSCFLMQFSPFLNIQLTFFRSLDLMWLLNTQNVEWISSEKRVNTTQDVFALLEQDHPPKETMQLLRFCGLGLEP